MDYEHPYREDDSRSPGCSPFLASGTLAYGHCILPTAEGMRDGNQLERMYVVGFKVPSGDLLEDDKKTSRWLEGGQMLLHVA